MPTSKQAKRLWWAEVVLALILFLSVGFNISYTNKVDQRSRQDTNTESRQNDRRWCDLLNTLNAAYTDPKNPPTSPLGIQLAAAVLRLKEAFGC